MGDACDEPDNRAPVAESETITVNEDSSNSAISLRATDVDGDTLTYIVVTGPTHGYFSSAATNYNILQKQLSCVQTDFTFKANDGR